MTEKSGSANECVTAFERKPTLGSHHLHAKWLAEHAAAEAAVLPESDAEAKKAA